MSRDLAKFQSDVRELVGPSQNFSIDRPHGDLPVHVDLTTKFSDGMGAHKISVDFNGNIRETSLRSSLFTVDKY